MIGTCCNLPLSGTTTAQSSFNLQALRGSLKASGKPMFALNDALGLHSLGCVRFEHGRYSGAAHLLKHALMIYLRHLGESDRHLVPILDRLGDCHLALREYSTAASFYRQALTIEEIHSGAHSVKILERLRKLSHACAHLGLHTESARLKERINHIEGHSEHQKVNYGTGLPKIFKRTMRLEALIA